MLVLTVGGYSQAMKMWHSILRVVLTLTFIELCLPNLIFPMADAINVTGLYDSGYMGGNTTNVTKIYPFVAPYHRNVTPGAVWVLPANKFDFGLGPFICECIEANGNVIYGEDYKAMRKELTHETATCCMPRSQNVAPFCIEQTASCCGDTFCKAGEACCGDFCCPLVSHVCLHAILACLDPLLLSQLKEKARKLHRDSR